MSPHKMRTNTNINQGAFLGIQGAKNLVDLAATAPSSNPPNTTIEGLAPLQPAVSKLKLS